MPPPILTIPLSAQDQRRSFASAYSVLEEAMSDRAFPGAAFGVLAQEQIVALDGVGRFTYEPDAPLVTASSVYDLASLTKVLATTAMAMLLHQRGKLVLETPLSHLLPGFSEGDADREKVTLRLLLTHSSGLPGYARLFAQASSREELLAACLRLPLSAPPGSHAEYSDPGFILLGEALAALAGEPLESFCKREIFTPLGMTSTMFRPAPAWRAFITPTEQDVSFRHRILQGEVQDENCFMLGGVSGHAGLFSNALDPLRYAKSLLTPSGLFTAATTDLFTARPGLPEGSSRALGWDTPSQPSSSGQFFSPHSAGHLGYAGTSLWIDFERKIAVVLLTNRTWPGRQSQAIRKVRPRFHDRIMEALGAAKVQHWD